MFKNRKTTKVWLSIGLIVLLAIATVHFQVLAQQAENKTDAFGSAGGRVTSANFETAFILGQSSPPGVIESKNFRNIGGFFASWEIISTTVTQTIPILHGRLNMISFNIQPSELDISKMLDDLQTLLVAQDDDGKFYIPPYGVNTIGTVDLSNGYQVYITGSADDNVINEGIPLIPQDYSQTLNNTKLFMISYPYQNPHPVTDVFASITSSVVVIQDDAGRFWIPMYGVNTIGNMLPGKGYQIFVNQAVSFSYPELTGGLAKPAEPATAVAAPQHFQFKETGLPYALVLTDSKEELSIGDELGIFDGNLCVGAAIFNRNYPLVIAAWEGNEEYKLAGFKAGQPIALRVWKASESKEMEVVGRFNTLEESAFKAKPISVLRLEAFVSPKAIPDAFGLDQNYPNPFNPETMIQYQLPKASQVQLRIYNLLGQEIRTLLNEPKEAGYHLMKWDGKDASGVEVSSGIYIYSIQAADFKMTKKMVKME